MTQATDVQRWLPDDLRQALEAGDPLVLLDVREDDERRYCAIPVPPTAGNLHVPIGEVSDHFNVLRQIVGDRPLVIYCHHGIRSLATARWLSDHGLSDVINLEGGIDAWSLEIDPTMPRY